jgi:hypothetical protein
LVEKNKIVDVCPFFKKFVYFFSLDMKNGIAIGLKVTEMQPITCECYSSCCVNLSY